ncbi:RsfS/YbeB/iojap family protein, partial [Ruminococcus bromii]|uniref:RsfS/YbeB/iojap family protein n=1 Tax=Ruminococcus bromii TaxID=40518 RepID=UPI00266BB414
MSSYDEAILAAKALSSKKGLDIQIIKIADVSVLADYMVIATGTSSTSDLKRFKALTTGNTIIMG